MEYCNITFVMCSHLGDNIMIVGSLKAKIISMTFFSDSNIKDIYNGIKANPIYNKADLVFLNSRLVFGYEHILGIMQILNERKKRNIISEIKNREIEFLLRVCCTDQISAALKANFGDSSNRSFVIITISDDDHLLQEIESEFARHGTIEYRSGTQVKIKDLITADTRKRDYIIEMFFREKIKDHNSPVLNSNSEFLKFLIERAAICLS